MTPRTVNVVCAKAPRKIGCVPAVRQTAGRWQHSSDYHRAIWRCSFCGARVKVIA